MTKTVRSARELEDWRSGAERRMKARESARLRFPYFDPAEAGIDARVLFVLEAPGPMASDESNHLRVPGSGFISVDNDDATAANFWRMRDEAGIGRDVALHWNIVPWYLGRASKKPNAAERKDGAECLIDLIHHLPKLELLVAIGRHAERGINRHVLGDLPSRVTYMSTFHCSGQAFANPAQKEHFRSAMAVIRQALDGQVVSSFHMPVSGGKTVKPADI